MGTRWRCDRDAIDGRIVVEVADVTDVADMTDMADVGAL